MKGSADLDHRSDLYSLGMTVYEMLAGELPFDEDSDEFAQMRTIVEDELPPPDKFNPQVPDRLSALVMRALEKNPDDRYQSAKEMHEAFEVFEENHREPSARGSSTPEPPTSAPQTTSSQEEASSEEGPRWATVAGLAVAAFLLVGIILWLIVEREEPVPPRTQLSVSSEPPGARVFLDRNRIGTTAPHGYSRGAHGPDTASAGRIRPDRRHGIAVGGSSRSSYGVSTVGKTDPHDGTNSPEECESVLGGQGRKIGRTPVTNHEVDSRQFRQYAKNDSLPRPKMEELISGMRIGPCPVAGETRRQRKAFQTRPSRDIPERPPHHAQTLA